MKQLLILSGKGGTGKTTVASAFIKLAEAKAYADCDVDAPNLHLIMKHKSDVRKTDYTGLPKAVIDPGLCRSCGICMTNCRFDAIQYSKKSGYSVDLYACEGCSVCEALCPAQAISMNSIAAGELKLYKNDSIFSTAQLKMGSGTSGKLVTEVKNQLKEESEGIDLSIIDGSPGIGCPVIASLSGVDMVLIVAEPSISGISDMERIINTADKFQVKTAVCINKYNTNLLNSDKIIRYCQKHNIPYSGRIPYDKKAIKAINNGLSIVEIDCSSGEAVKSVYRNTMDLLYDLNVRS
ncbi:MAG: ATP-binding protein [Eubacteriales bacterium]|nr:ATP-binding protein [Eubacteriales bacterium]MDD4121740.1 ATP-binding protein [Eubacteriales bacterium]